MTFKLKGVFPALVTPIGKGDPLNAPVNFEVMKQLLDYVINGGVNGVVPVGCTGHAAVLTVEEQIDLIDKVNKHVNGRVHVLAGDGSNCTRDAIDLAKKIEDIGVTIHMQISPYQNKPTQEGLFQHYGKIIESINGTLIVYNVPGRTGCNILPETVQRLASEYSSIIGIKEASGDIEQIKKTIELTKDIKGFNVISGDDPLTLDIIKNGGTGVISVTGNLYPEGIVELVNKALDGNFEEADKLHEKLLPLSKIMFIETNPSPLHYSLRKIGIPVGVPRLPLVDLMPESKEEVDGILRSLKLTE